MFESKVRRIKCLEKWNARFVDGDEVIWGCRMIKDHYQRR